MVRQILINLPKIVVITGTTASGKTELAVELAYKFNGEIVSADSRQVFIGLDIGTGKDLDEFEVKRKSRALGAKVKIPYHLIDIVDPKEEFNLAMYQKLAYKTIDDILSRGKLPIIVGGTGLYSQAVVDGYNLSESHPDKELRQKLEKYSVDRLIAEINKINKSFADKLNSSERKNKRRLIRYLEILKNGINKENKKNKKYNTLIIGVTFPRDELQKRIKERLLSRLGKQDMVGEVKRLHKQGLSWKRLESFGLEYKFISFYLQNKLGYDEMVEKLFIAIRQFAKRQLTWLKRWEKQGQKIYWLNNRKQIYNLVNKYRAE